MSNVKYTATEGLKILVSEIGLWLTELTTGNATGAGVSTDLSATVTDLDATGTVVKASVMTGADLSGWGTFTTADYLSRAYGADLDVASGEAVSLCAWVKTATITGTQGIIGNLSAGASGDRGGYGLRLTGSSLEFAVSDSAGALTQATDSIDFTSGSWVFIAATLSTAGAMKLYKNGVQVASATGATIDATAELFQIGVETSTGVPANAFAGSIALAKVYGSVLTPAQIRTMYNLEAPLFKAYSPYTAIGSEYDLSLSVNAANRSEGIQSVDAIALSGKQETIFGRRDVYFNLNIIRRTRNNMPELRRFLHSIEAGQTFSFDKYGTAAIPDEPLDVIANPGFSEAGSELDDNYSIGLTVREVST